MGNILDSLTATLSFPSGSSKELREEEGDDYSGAKNVNVNGFTFKPNTKKEDNSYKGGFFVADRDKIKPAIERFRASASGRRMVRARSKFLSRIRTEPAESFLESITGVSPNIIKFQNLIDTALEHLTNVSITYGRNPNDKEVEEMRLVAIGYFANPFAHQQA